MEPPAAITLVGPGAIGLNYGGLLAHSGVALSVLARSGADELRAAGIRVERTDPVSGEVGETLTAPLAAVETDASRLGPADWVLVAAKATANDRLPSQIGRLVEPGRTVIATLQNGMGNAERFAGRFPDNPVVAGLCFICVNRIAPGVVANLMPGRMEVGSLGDRFGDAARAFVAALEAADVQARFSPSLDGALWRKLCWNVPFNGLAIAAGGVTTDCILADPELQARARRLMEEVRAAAAAHGIAIDDAFLEGQFSVTEGMGAYRPSSLIDYAEGRAVEVEAIWGEPLRRGRAAGIAMPELERLYGELKRRAGVPGVEGQE